MSVLVRHYFSPKSLHNFLKSKFIVVNQRFDADGRKLRKISGTGRNLTIDFVFFGKFSKTEHLKIASVEHVTHGAPNLLKHSILQMNLLLNKHCVPEFLIMNCFFFSSDFELQNCQGRRKNVLIAKPLAPTMRIVFISNRLQSPIYSHHHILPTGQLSTDCEK